MTNLLFGPPFGRLRFNVRTSSIARWIARSRLPIRNNWTLLASSYGRDVISRYWSKSALFIARGGSLWAQILGGRGCRSEPLSVSENLSVLLPHSEDRVILSSFVWVQYRRVTDGQTELPWLIQRSALQEMWPRCKNTADSDTWSLQYRRILEQKMNMNSMLDDTFQSLQKYASCQTVLCEMLLSVL